MPISSYLRTPLTDLTGTMLSHQDFGRCAVFEMKTMNCYEAYGHARAVEKCADLIQDYNECFGMHKQVARFNEMRKERYRQYYSGERSKKDLYADGPKLDSFQ